MIQVAGNTLADFQAAIDATPSSGTIDIGVEAIDATFDTALLNVGARLINWHLSSDSTVNGDIIQDPNGTVQTDAELLPGMTVLGGTLFRSPQHRAIVPFQIIRHNKPVNFFGSEAGFVLQVANDTAIPPGGGVDQAIMSFESTGDGAVTDIGGGVFITNSWSSGLRVQQIKSGSGSAHNITLNGQLKATSSYNEIGGVQGYLRNVGSTNGYMSFMEGRLSDNDGLGGAPLNTRMIGALAGIEKNYSGPNAKISHAFYAQSMGTQDLDDAFKTDGKFQDGLDFSDSLISRWSVLMRPDGKMGWLRASDLNSVIANCNRILQNDKEVVVQLGASTTGYGFAVRDGGGYRLLTVDSFSKALISRQHIINSGAANNVFVGFTNGGVGRFNVGLGGAGEDLRFDNFNDPGAQISTAMMLARANGNLHLGTVDNAGGSRVFTLGNAVAPTFNIPGGSVWVENGALKFRGSNGTITTLAAA